MYLGSDAIALAPFTDSVSYLEDGDWVVVQRKGAEVRDSAGQTVQRPVLKSNAGRIPDRQGQLPPLHGQGNSRAARGRRPHARALSRHDQRPGGAAARSCPSTSAPCNALRLPPAAPPTTPAWLRNTGSSASPACRSRSTLRPSFAIATRLIATATWRCSSHNRARPPTRWRPCATRASRASTSSPSSTCRPRPSPARATW